MRRTLGVLVVAVALTGAACSSDKSSTKNSVSSSSTSSPRASSEDRALGLAAIPDTGSGGEEPKVYDGAWSGAKYYPNSSCADLDLPTALWIEANLPDPGLAESEVSEFSSFLELVLVFDDEATAKKAYEQLHDLLAKCDEEATRNGGDVPQALDDVSVTEFDPAVPDAFGIKAVGKFNGETAGSTLTVVQRGRLVVFVGTTVLDEMVLVRARDLVLSQVEAAVG